MDLLNLYLTSITFSTREKLTISSTKQLLSQKVCTEYPGTGSFDLVTDQTTFTMHLLPNTSRNNLHTSTN